MFKSFFWYPFHKVVAAMRPAAQIFWNHSPKSLIQIMTGVLNIKLNNTGLSFPNWGHTGSASSVLCTITSEPFGEFVTDAGRKFLLYKKYRDRIKKQWRLDSWPTIALLNVHNRIDLGSVGTALVQEINEARTLPVSLDEIADIVNSLASTYPDELIQSDISSPFTKTPAVAARVTDREADSAANYYRKVAFRILTQYASYERIANISRLRFLEVGCGMGYAVMAMRTLGVGEAIGIDSGEKDYRWISERPAIARRLTGNKADSQTCARIIKGDGMHMELEDNGFDLIYSASVLEHVSDLDKAFSEMARVLRPGGLMIHSVDPFFSPKGGHASCTLDFPWGHVRLTELEFRRYMREWRPFEYTRALEMYERGFNAPRVSLFDLEGIICKAGLALISWQEHWHDRHFPNNDVWKDANALHRTVGMRDLGVDRLNLVLMKQ